MRELVAIIFNKPSTVCVEELNAVREGDGKLDEDTIVVADWVIILETDE